MNVHHSAGPILNIKKMILGETGTYNDVFQRPYQTHLGDDEFNMMRDMTEGFRNLESETLANCAGTFLNPRAQPGSQINIDHGWGEQRLRFMMSIQFEGKLSNTEQIVTGYTDRADLSHSGHLNPDTRFFINNVITLRHVDTRTQTGMVTTARMTDNFQVLRDTSTNQSDVTLRPADVVRAQGTHAVLDGLEQLSGDKEHRTFFDDGDDTLFHDARNTFGPSETTRLSRRKNNLNANYMSGILKAYKTATAGEEEYSSEDTVYERTQGQVTEPYSLDNALLKTLIQNTGFSQNTSFSLTELRELCPHADQVMVLSRASNSAQMLPNQRGQTEGWGGSDNATMIANILASTVPALALDHMITKVWFTSTNETLSGDTVTELNHTAQNPVSSFTSGVDITPHIQAFLNRITHYVMRDITHRGMMGVSISVRYEALGDTFVSVSCDGEPPIDYIIPTFCDSLFSPILSNNTKDLYSLSSDFQTLLDYSHGYANPQTEPTIITQPNPGAYPPPAPGGWNTPQPQPQQGPDSTYRTLFD